MAKKVVIPPETTSKRDVPVEDQLMQPGPYEVTEDEVFTVVLHLEKVDSRWCVRDEPGPRTISHWATFRMWTYEECVELRKLATRYDELRREHVMNHDYLDRLKLQRLLKDWSFAEQNERLKLHHVNGVMTDDCYKKVLKLHPTILRNLLLQMNMILEASA